VVRLAATEPLFIDVVACGGLAPARRALRVCRYAKRVVGLPALLHVSCADLSVEEVRCLLREAREAGVDNVLAERGASAPASPADGGSPTPPTSPPSPSRPPFRPRPDGFAHAAELVAFIRAYLPGDVVNARAQATPAYRAWADDGLLVLTEGTMIDYARIEADLRADCRRFKVQEIAFDQYGSNQICGNLAASGLPATIEAKRAATFTPPARDLEARVNHGKFRHDGNSLFKFAASNAVVERRTDDSILPKKESADSQNKIDPIDATLQAMASRLRGLRAHKELQMIVLGGRRA